MRVAAHPNGTELDSVGNRIADDYAGVVSNIKAQVLRRCDSMIDLQQQEEFVQSDSTMKMVVC